MIQTIEGAIAWLLRGLVLGYKRTLSPLLPRACRFDPTCSEYALEALRRKRLHRALWLIVRRLARCQPFHAGGFDPVPEEPGDRTARRGGESAPRQ